jgi:hypothetical protein
MTKPGKAKGGSLMIGFLTMTSDIHRHSVAVLPHSPMILHKVRKFQFFSLSVLWEISDVYHIS